MADLSQYTDEELLALYGEPVKPVEPAKEPERETGFFEGGGRQIQRRGIGLIQLPMEAVGATDNEFYKASQRAAKKLADESKGTGFWDTLGEIVGDPINAAFAPVAAGGWGVGSLAKLFGMGAAEGFSRPVESDEDSRLANAGVSGVTTMVAAPVLGSVLSKVGSYADDAVNVGKNTINSIRSKIGNIADDGLVGLEVSTGATYDDFAKALQGMSEDAIALFQDGVKSGLSPRQAYIAAKAKEKGVTLTSGMLTQNPSAQRLEDYAAQGVLNNNAYKIATATNESNKTAVDDWASKLLSDVSGSPDRYTDETTVADAVATAVKNKAAELKTPAEQAYKIGSTSKARVATDDLADFVPNLKATLRSDGIEYTASPLFQRDIKLMQKLVKPAEIQPKPVVSPKIDGKKTQAETLNSYLTSSYKKADPVVQKDALEPAIKSFKWPAVEKMQQRLNSRAQFGVNLNTVADYTKKQEILSYRTAARKFREHTDNIITQGLLKNPDEAAAQLRNAPTLWKQYKQAIYGNDGKAALGVIVDNNLTDRQVADLFGSGLAGKGDTEKVVTQLKNVLGEQSPEFGQVRGMFLNRLFKGALTQGDDIGKKSFGVALNTQWRQFKTKNKALMDALFTPDQQKEIGDFVSTAYLMHARNASKVNPSGSGIVTMDGVINLLQRMGASGTIVGDIARAGAKAVLLRKNSKQAITSILEPLKALGNESTVIADALRSIGAKTAGAQANRVLSDSTRNVQEPAAQEIMPQAEPENPLEGMSDEELLQMYNQQPEEQPQGDDGLQALPDDIRQNEGLRHNSYLDTVGARTVGYGFNMDSGIARKVWKQAGIPVSFDDVYEGKAAISDAHAEALGRQSFNIALNDAMDIYDNFNSLTPARQEALLDLSYQLGKTKLSKFTEFNSAVKNGKWVDAARHLLRSKAAAQTPERARENARKLLRNA